jgi:hypothetical protein
MRTFYHARGGKLDGCRVAAAAVRCARLAAVVRHLAAVACVAWLVAAGSLPTLHVHASGDHEHVEHHGGPGFHLHRRPIEAAPAGAPASRRVAPCDPGEHALSLSATAMAGKEGLPQGPGPAATSHVMAIDGSPLAATPRDVRAHSPPRLSDGPLRAPPVVHPA